MKKTYLLLLILSISFSFGQNHRKEFDEMVTSEMHSASKLLNLLVNTNTLNYDITYHKLEFTVNPAVYFISGKVTTTFTALANMNTVTFDLSNPIVVSSVKKNNIDLNFVQNGNNELVITLPSMLSIGSSDTVEIIYSGQPPVSGFSAFASQSHNGTPVLWTLSEPFGARDWWPCKQDLNDKINSIDVYITAPSQYVAVSNGIEPEAPIVNGTNKTTHFHHSYPIPAYLICMAVTNYTVYTQSAGSGANSYPIVNYIYPENFTAVVQEQLNQTPLILDYFSTLFELYPFSNEKYGHAQFGWGGGMEHTTVSFMNNFNRGLIAHEMAHQWFGDKITCGTWKDIWLNEGFATYLAALVIENFDGQDAFRDEKSYMIGNITSQTGGNVYLTDTQATNVNRIFSGRLTYNKGAMVLNMLRFKLGDAVFFQGVRNYLADTNLAYKYAVTSDFKSHMELTSGLDLTEFFNDWIVNQGYPTYSITSQNFGTGQAKITINQTQSNTSVNYFEMPVPVRLFDVNGNFLDVTLENTFDGQEYIVNVPFQVVDVIFDINQNIISKNNVVLLGNETFNLEKSISVYPNPTSETLTINVPRDLEVKNIIIFNSLGQKVLESSKLNFSVSQLSTGIHFVDIITDKGTFHKKIIKK